MDKIQTWWGWKAPIGLGIFLLTAALALAIFIYTIFNFIGTIEEMSRPADQGLTSQELQQLESQQTAPTVPATSGSAGTAAAGQ